MSQTSTTFFVGIGPSGSLQSTVPLTTPTATFLSTASLSTTTMSATSNISRSASASASATATPAPSSPSHTPNIGAIVGGTLGGIAALLWFLGLLYFAHRHSWFHRPGYKRQKEERGMFGKRAMEERPRSRTSDPDGPFGDRPSAPLGPQAGLGARTFGQPKPNFSEPPRSNFGEPPRANFGEPPRSGFGEPPRSTFNDPPRSNLTNAPRANIGEPPREPPRTNFSEPPRTNFNDPPRSNFGDRPISGFGDRERPKSSFGDRERPRSSFGDHGRRSASQEPGRRGFFGGGMLNSDGTGGEWEGAGARRGDHTPEVEEKGSVWAWFARARDNAARKKRVKAEYEEDMRQMRIRSAVESDYTRY